MGFSFSAYGFLATFFDMSNMDKNNILNILNNEQILIKK